MSYGFYDDVSKPNNEIPDLQISELQVSVLQKDGLFYVPDTDQNKAKHYQSQTKYETYFRLKSCIKHLIFLYSKHSKLSKSCAFGKWRNIKTIDFPYEDFKFLEKWGNSLKTFYKHREITLLKNFVKWNLTSKKIAKTKEFRQKNMNRVKAEEELNDKLLRISLQKEYLEKTILEYKDKHKNTDEAIKSNEFTRESKDYEEELNNIKAFKALSIKNEELRDKLKSAQEVYNLFVNSMSALIP
jgi:hypothetical protein